MSLDPRTLAAILGMAAATFLCRGGGYWLFSQVKPTPLLRAILAYVPGTLFVSYVVPALASGRLNVWVGALATVAAMLVLRNIAVAILGGTAMAWLVWSVT